MKKRRWWRRERRRRKMKEHDEKKGWKEEEEKKGRLESQRQTWVEDSCPRETKRKKQSTYLNFWNGSSELLSWCCMIHGNGELLSGRREDRGGSGRKGRRNKKWIRNRRRKSTLLLLLLWKGGRGGAESFTYMATILISMSIMAMKNEVIVSHHRGGWGWRRRGEGRWRRGGICWRSNWRMMLMMIMI